MAEAVNQTCEASGDAFSECSCSGGGAGGTGATGGGAGVGASSGAAGAGGTGIGGAGAGGAAGTAGTAASTSGGAGGGGGFAGKQGTCNAPPVIGGCHIHETNDYCGAYYDDFNGADLEQNCSGLWNPGGCLGTWPGWCEEPDNDYLSILNFYDIPASSLEAACLNAEGVWYPAKGSRRPECARGGNSGENCATCLAKALGDAVRRSCPLAARIALVTRPLAAWRPAVVPRAATRIASPPSSSWCLSPVCTARLATT